MNCLTTIYVMFVLGVLGLAALLILFLWLVLKMVVKNAEKEKKEGE